MVAKRLDKKTEDYLTTLMVRHAPTVLQVTQEVPSKQSRALRYARKK